MLRDESVAVEAMWCGVGCEVGHEERCARLHRTLKRIVKARGALEAQEAEALREADRLRLWRHYGYGSLLEYMEMEMGYTPRAALERLRVAKAIEELPEIAERMAQGDLSFSAGRELTRVAIPETEGQWLEATSDKNVRQVEQLVSGHKKGDKPTDRPDPRLRKRTLRYEEIGEETAVLLRQARQVLEREQGERLTDDAFLRVFARMIIDGVGSPPRTRGPYQIGVTICEQCKRGWQHGGGAVTEMSPPAIEAALCDAQHIGSIDGQPRPTQDLEVCDEERAPAVKRIKSDIPPALRRKVNHRDRGRCRVPWCRSSRNCDQHHLIPLSRGGTHTEDNLITLCESHHIAHHEGALIIAGPASTASFKRREHSSFAIAERAVETAAALKSLGFDRHEVKAALERTRTHVGTTQLTLEQWIKIALSYCPKPRA